MPLHYRLVTEMRVAPSYTVTPLSGLTDGATVSVVYYSIDLPAVPDNATIAEGVKVDGGAFEALPVTVNTGESVVASLSVTHITGNFETDAPSAYVVTGDPPVISNDTWDDGTKTADFDITETATLHWAIYLAADGAPTLNSNGTWTGTTQETGSETIAAGSQSIEISVTTTTGDRLIYGAIDVDSEVSNLVIETISLAAWLAVSVTGVSDGAVTLDAQGTPSSAPSAPTVTGVSNGAVTLDAV